MYDWCMCRPDRESGGEACGPVLEAEWGERESIGGFRVWILASIAGPHWHEVSATVDWLDSASMSRSCAPLGRALEIPTLLRVQMAGRAPKKLSRGESTARRRVWPGWRLRKLELPSESTPQWPGLRLARPGQA